MIIVFQRGLLHWLLPVWPDNTGLRPRPRLRPRPPRALALALALAPLAREIASSYYVRKRQMEEVMHMCGCVPNLETPIGRTKKLRYRVIKYVFTRVRAAYRGHLVTDYRGLHVG